MKRLQKQLFHVMFCLFLFMGTIPSRAVDLRVGQTYTCTLTSPPSYLKGCQWTISDINALEFVSSPSTYSTSVMVRAKAAQSTTSPVIVHCTYYYMELDPTTGRYIYQRTGYQDWYFSIADPGPKSVTVSPSSLTMDVGDSPRRLTASVSPSTATSTVTWSVTSGYDVVSVSSAGYVTAKQPGDAIVTATSTVNGVSGGCRVHVNSVSPTGISINPSSRQSLAINSSQTFSYTLSPSYAITDVTWRLEGDTYAATLSDGRLTGKAEGTVKVVVSTDNGYSDYCYVDIYKPVLSSITFDASSRNITMPVGDRRTLSYSVSPSNAIYTVTWESDATHIVTVNQSGRIEAKSPGTAHITVTTDNGKSATTTVTVAPQPTAITIDKEIKIGVGQKKRMVYKLSPANAQTLVTWSNSNPDVISVSDDGWVTGLKVGTATLKVQTNNGLSAECKIIVPEPFYKFYVWLRDGSIEGYAIEEMPLVKTGEDLFTLTTSTTTVNYAAKDVLKFTLEDAALNDPAVGINHLVVQPTEIEYRSERLTFSSARPDAPVRVYDMQGKLVAHYRILPDGTLNISLQEYPQGIYIIKTEKSSYKIIKK